MKRNASFFLGASTTAGYDPCVPTGPAFNLSSNSFTSLTSDMQSFVSQTICGNTSISARVVSIDGGGWAGIQMRENATPGSRKAVLKTQLSNIIRREARAMPNGSTQSQQLIRPGHIWLRLNRTGNTFQGYASVNGNNWNFAFSANIIMPNCIQVGLITESINNTTVTSSVIDQVETSQQLNGLQTPLFDIYSISEGKSLEVWPNPSTGQFNLSLPRDFINQILK